MQISDVCSDSSATKQSPRPINFFAPTWSIIMTSVENFEKETVRARLNMHKNYKADNMKIFLPQLSVILGP